MRHRITPHTIFVDKPVTRTLNMLSFAGNDCMRVGFLVEVNFVREICIYLDELDLDGLRGVSVGLKRGAQHLVREARFYEAMIVLHREELVKAPFREALDGGDKVSRDGPESFGHAVATIQEIYYSRLHYVSTHMTPPPIHLRTVTVSDVPSLTRVFRAAYSARLITTRKVHLLWQFKNHFARPRKLSARIVLSAGKIVGFLGTVPVGIYLQGR